MPWEIVLLWLSPALSFWVALQVPRAVRSLRPLRDNVQGRVRGRADHGRTADGFESVGIAGAPLERLVADLHRLSTDLDRVMATVDMPGRVLRLKAFSQAYDDTLLRACTLLEVPVCSHPPLSDVERLETEAALAQQGLRW